MNTRIRFGGSRYSASQTRFAGMLQDLWGGVAFIVIGIVVLLVGFSKPLNMKVVAAGAVLAILGIFFSRRGITAWRRLKASFPTNQ